jgi:hypothetical protein
VCGEDGRVVGRGVAATVASLPPVELALARAVGLGGVLDMPAADTALVQFPLIKVPGRLIDGHCVRKGAEGVIGGSRYRIEDFLARAGVGKKFADEDASVLGERLNMRGLVMTNIGNIFCDSGAIFCKRGPLRFGQLLGCSCLLGRFLFVWVGGSSSSF